MTAPLPWMLDTFPNVKVDGFAGIYAADGSTVVFLSSASQTDYDNLRRIVAAVNATAALTIEALERIEQNGDALLVALRASLIKLVS